MLIAFATVAMASPSYPAEVQNLSGGACTPACTLCHESNLGGSGTITRAFGMAMQDRGLTGGSDVTGLADAYTMLVDDVVDSDSDGTADAEELAVSDDPNGGSNFCGTEQPVFGCLSHAPMVPAGLGLVLLAAAARRRRS